MSSQDANRQFTPGTGVFRPADDPSFREGDHMAGFNLAIQDALTNFGRANGKYHATLTLSGTVAVTNPGNMIEYIAKFT